MIEAPLAAGGLGFRAVGDHGAGRCRSRGAPPGWHGPSSIVDAIPHGIAVYSADHHVTMFNRAYSEVMSGVRMATI